ncbi:MAG: AraC family transcriptional regulator [Eubacteriales bacterium]|nr:AraC family transcriptional regulator [Eubacteriales bacterium]
MEEQKRYEEIPFADAMFPIRIIWDKRLSVNTTGRDSANTWHEQLEILYILRGGAEVECGFKRFITADGDIVIINPCEVHSVNYYTGKPHFHCLMIDPQLYSGGKNDICGIKYIEPMTKRLLHFNNLIRNNEQVRIILSDMIKEIKEAKTAYEIAVKGDILKLLSELFRNELRAVYSEEETVKNIRGYEQISPALLYISENYVNNITLTQLSQMCCMNPSYFCRRFKAVTGKTVISYINEYRISKAEALLITTDLPVSEIAVLTGFSDSSYFSRLFKVINDISPNLFRNKSKHK